MDYDGGFIMQKTVDWSLLNDGMTIPVSACAMLHVWDESILTHTPHHIDYFTRSQNNDSTNIIIISQNYHRIIHKNVFDKPNDQSKDCFSFGMARKRRMQSNNPRFNRKKFLFEFENGEVLRLKLFEHLRS